jgi:2'-5' RNA ligase
MSMSEYTFSIQLFFDPDSEARITDIIRELSRMNLINPTYIPEQYRPHISLSCHQALEQAAANAAVEALVAKRSVFPLTFSHYGVFTGSIHALYLGPTLNQPLFNLHQALHGTFAGIHDSCWHLYRPFNWVPHCAIMIDTDVARIHAGLNVVLPRSLFAVNVKYMAAVGYRKNRYYEFADECILSETACNSNDIDKLEDCQYEITEKIPLLICV